MKNWYAPGYYGLHWPRDKRHVLPALLWGLALTTVVNAGNTWLDVLLHNKQTTRDIVHTHQNICGWVAFEWIYMGPT